MVLPLPTENKATPFTLNGTGTLSIDLTIPKAQVISGRLVSSDGDPVIWDPDYTPYLNLQAADKGDTRAVEMTVDAQGNWSALVGP